MVFVDTGGWIALAVKRDRYHKKAATYHRKISNANVRLVTSNYVLSETYTRIRYDDGHFLIVPAWFVEGSVRRGIR